jgi:hypothetical protein
MEKFVHRLTRQLEAPSDVPMRLPTGRFPRGRLCDGKLCGVLLVSMAYGSMP